MLLKDNEIKRSSGILMPIFSLPSPYGIGTLGEEAYKFVDFLKKAGQSYWQILPLNPTNYGDSPYQSFSSAAGWTSLRAELSAAMRSPFAPSSVMITLA